MRSIRVEGTWLNGREQNGSNAVRDPEYSFLEKEIEIRRVEFCYSIFKETYKNVDFGLKKSAYATPSHS